MYNRIKYSFSRLAIDEGIGTDSCLNCRKLHSHLVSAPPRKGLVFAVHQFLALRVGCSHLQAPPFVISHLRHSTKRGRLPNRCIANLDDFSVADLPCGEVCSCLPGI